MTALLRPYRAEDEAALADICILTGDAGMDARRCEDEPNLLPLIFVAPYLRAAPECAFVLADDEGVCGYALGVPDTAKFNAWAAAEYFPGLCPGCPDPGPDPSHWQGSDWLRRWIHHPPDPPDPALAPWPAHGHIDLLPRAQGKGLAAPLLQCLMDALFAKGVPGLHLGVDPRNVRALRFYEKTGFARVLRTNTDGGIFVARALSPPGQ